ncbi:hypothetical protein I5T99_01450 [Stenotrophomonas maltophilia]|nr:hypothetical protein [Stenotrophomonas maltophilia]
MQQAKPTCFVIQAFDGNVYDRRYRETIRPALLLAEVEPQRADEILGLNPIIEKIESAIASASICIAEVSEDNPNVWLELGYALALNRPVVILCEKGKRPRLPFDVQHRPVVFYRTDSRSGYEELESNLVKLIQHELSNEQRSQLAPTLNPNIANNTDLDANEIAVLSLAFAFWPTEIGSISHWDLDRKLSSAGLTEVGIALGVATLTEKNFLISRSLVEEDSNGQTYPVKHYQITPEGIQWMKLHKDLLVTRKEPVRPIPRKESMHPNNNFIEDDDIPF